MGKQAEGSEAKASPESSYFYGDPSHLPGTIHLPLEGQVMADGKGILGTADEDDFELAKEGSSLLGTAEPN